MRNPCPLIPYRGLRKVANGTANGTRWVCVVLAGTAKRRLWKVLPYRAAVEEVIVKGKAFYLYALPTSLVRVHLVHRMNTLPARLGYSGGLCEALLGVSRVCQPEERSAAGTYDLRDRFFGQPMSVVIGPAKNLTHRA